MKAVDYSWARPTIADLKAAGITDVFRYVGPPQWGKTIIQAEYDSLVAGDIRVWLTFENRADDCAGGCTAGRTNAALATKYVPSGYEGPIFFACDESLSGRPLAIAVEYLHGACISMGSPAKTGVYGEGALLQAVKDAGYAGFFWQSASTSFPGNATTLPFVQVQQTVGSLLPSTDTDLILRPMVALEPLVTIKARALYPGDSGSDVASLQGAVNAHIAAGTVPHTAIPITGNYDVATIDAVRAFQASRKMIAVNHAGQSTLQHLYGPAA